MGKYRNFKIVIYCTAQSMVRITESELDEQLAFFQKYTGCDKVYLEPYRDGLMIPDQQLQMVKGFFMDRGIEVSGALTTTCEDLCEADAEKQRLGGTYCYSNQAMRERLVKTVRYTARHFDEFIKRYAAVKRLRFFSPFHILYVLQNCLFIFLQDNQHKNSSLTTVRESENFFSRSGSSIFCSSLFRKTQAIPIRTRFFF